jgi:hypothetical protein
VNAILDSEAASDSNSSSKLPLRNVIGLSYSTYFHHFTDVLRISWLWLVLIAPLIGIASWLQWSWLTGMIKGGLTAGLALAAKPVEMVVLGNLASLVLIVAGVSIAVAWHRRLILDEQPGLSGSNVATGSFWRYVGVGLATLLIVAVPALAISVPIIFLATGPSDATAFIPLLIPFLLYFAAVAVLLRLSVLLPARAVGNLGLTFKQAWLRTRGNTWRLFWGIVACTMPPLLAAQLLLALLVGFPGANMFAGEAIAGKMTAINVIFSIYYLLIVPIGIGFLSHSYRHFFPRA